MSEPTIQSRRISAYKRDCAHASVYTDTHGKWFYEPHAAHGGDSERARQAAVKRAKNYAQRAHQQEGGR